MKLNFLKRSRVLLGFFFFIWYSTISFSQRVTPITEKGLDSLITNRDGNILLLNIWATWCEPCKEEFPDLIKLSSKYKKKNVQIIALSVDYPDEVNEKIIPFLDSLRVPFQIFVADFASQDSLINTLNREWSGAVPATFIFDKNGIQKKFLLGKQTYNQFTSVVDELLKKDKLIKKQYR
ncbi:MAG: TlpA disulfide reductase family protein [Bacteroidota bacterium]|nr:TlpA disulfide reductase family protein [Bacteroidota bacterium]